MLCGCNLCLFLRRLLELFFQETLPVDDYTTLTTMLTDDTVVTADQTKLTADQAADATAHADSLSLLQASGPKAIISPDGTSVMIFTANPDNTVGVVSYPIVAPPAP